MSVISVSELESLYKRYNTRESILLSIGDGEGRFTFEVKHRLNDKEVTEVVTSVCNGVVGAGTGIYRPEMRDYFLRVAVIKAYTNISLPQDSRCWELVYGTPIFAMVTGHDRRPVIFDGRDYDDNMVIDVEQYEQILTAIDQKITYAVLRKEHGQMPFPGKQGQAW